MALKKRIETESGISLVDAYIKIEMVAGSKDELTITTNSYVSQSASVEGRPFVTQRYYVFQPSVTEDSPNFIKQGYEYLKSLAEFDGAIDV